jgi:hypothetical protein
VEIAKEDAMHYMKKFEELKGILGSTEENKDQNLEHWMEMSLWIGQLNSRLLITEKVLLAGGFFFACSWC